MSHSQTSAAAAISLKIVRQGISTERRVRSVSGIQFCSVSSMARAVTLPVDAEAGLSQPERHVFPAAAAIKLDVGAASIGARCCEACRDRPRGAVRALERM